MIPVIKDENSENPIPSYAAPFSERTLSFLEIFSCCLPRREQLKLKLFLKIFELINLFNEWGFEESKPQFTKASRPAQTVHSYDDSAADAKSSSSAAEKDLGNFQTSYKTILSHLKEQKVKQDASLSEFLQLIETLENFTRLKDLFEGFQSTLGTQGPADSKDTSAITGSVASINNTVSEDSTISKDSKFSSGHSVADTSFSAENLQLLMQLIDAFKK